MLRQGRWLILLLCTACCDSYLSVRTEYLSIENLASYYVNTPDPLLDNPPVGQRLIIRWSMPKYFLDLKDLHLQVTLRFRNREESVFNVDIFKERGHYVYALVNEDYFAKGGILTYKVDLLAGDELIEEWRHQIWTDLIVLSPPEEKAQKAAEELENF